MAVCVRESIEIEAPIERVWKLVMDPRHHGEWVPAHRESRGLPDRELREGDSFEQVLCLVGRSFDVEWTLLERDDPNHALWKARGPKGACANVRFALSGENGSTRFDYTNEFEPPGNLLRGFTQRAAAAPARRQARKSLKLLKSKLEG
jgi:carbon monoxide dehydrogenase subunit G